MKRAVCFVGWSGTGKTRIVSSLISELTKSGARVSAVKKTTHHISGDREGSDTDRFRAAGSGEVSLAGPDSALVFLQRQFTAGDVLHLFSDSDYLISEGLYLPGFPCIETVGEKSLEEGPKRPPEEVHAYVMDPMSTAPDYVAASGKPVFRPGDTVHIISFLEELWNEK
jgi:molybdopterin-guanine dinucleotide biosynthesis protein MobB